MASSDEAALGFAVSGSGVLTAVGAALAAIAVSLVTVLQLYSSWRIVLLLPSILVLAASIVIGAMFPGLVTTKLRQHAKRSARPFRDTVEDTRIKRVARAQWLLFAFGILLFALSAL